MNDYLTIKEAAVLEKISYRAMAMRVVKNKVDVIVRPSQKQKGKTITMIAVSSLSIPAQKRYLETLVESIPPHLGPLLPEEKETPPLSGEEKLIAYNKLGNASRKQVDERFDILSAVLAEMEGVKYGVRTNTLNSLCGDYGITRETFGNWHRAYEKAGIAGLANKKFGQSRSKMTKVQTDYILALIKQNPFRRVVRIFEYINLKYPEPAVSGATISRFVINWKQKNHSLFCAMENPDKWKNLYPVSFGSHSEKAKHFLHYIELDSTPADVMCADGKRYCIIGAIDIFSRKPKCYVSPSSSSQGVAALFRSLILNWGVPETIVRDNGKDYISNHVNSILTTLEIGAVTVAPFTPEGKPHIERFFRSLSGSLFEELDGYIGHNVGQRKAIESRRSFATRLMDSESDPIQINIMPDELQTLIDNWIENVYNHRVHTGINDTPEHKAAQSRVPVRQVEDERALDILLVPVGEATVQKKGVTYDKALYQSPELSAWVKTRVQVRRDMDNAGVLYVFDLDGQYITTAWDPSLEGMPSIDYQSARKAQKRDIRTRKNAIETLTENPMLDLIAEKTAVKKLVSLPRKRRAKTAALDAAEKAALRRAGVKPPRFKSVAEQMDEDGWGDGEETDYESTDYLDFLKDFDIEIVNL